MLASPDTSLVLLRADDGRVAAVESTKHNGGIVLPGGKVEPGETPEEAAVREMEEETGLVVDGLVPLGETRSQDRVIALFAAPSWHGTLRSSDEGRAIWTTEDELCGPASPFAAFNGDALALAAAAHAAYAVADAQSATDLPWRPVEVIAGSLGDSLSEATRSRATTAEARRARLPPPHPIADEADRALRAKVVKEARRIARAFGTPPPPVVFTNTVEHAESAYDLDLLVNPLWIRTFLARHGAIEAERQAVLHWILGHEMTHFCVFDDDPDPGPFGNGLCSNVELRADFRAGQALAFLGDAVDTVQPAVEEVTPGAPGRVRMDTLRAGFAFQRSKDKEDQARLEAPPDLGDAAAAARARAAAAARARAAAAARARAAKEKAAKAKAALKAKCEAAGGTWDAAHSHCITAAEKKAKTNAAAKAKCEAAGGTWDPTHSHCTPADTSQQQPPDDSQQQDSSQQDGSQQPQDGSQQPPAAPDASPQQPQQPQQPAAPDASQQPQATVTAITISPASASASIGKKTPFKATATMSDGASQDATKVVTWSSSDPKVATVAEDGSTTALASGTTTLTVAYGTVNGTASLIVDKARLSGLDGDLDAALFIPWR